ncbi:MAG TPA: FkbM family methyltransferase [Acetobacteraceae bacterium]
MSDIIVLRTHYYDQFVDQMVRRLQRQTSRSVVAVVDERNGIVAIPGDIRKIAVDPVALGVLAHPDYGWRCGDYGLYAAMLAVPHALNFWLIEPDVRIHSNDPEAFFNGRDASRNADFVTAWSVEASPSWVWYKSMAPFAERSFHCMLQLCRVSRVASEYLLAERRSLSNRFARAQLAMEDWPNDEAFVATTLVNGGYRIATFHEHAPDFHTKDIFTFTKPTSARWLDGLPPDNGIYHPVERGAKFLDRAKKYLSMSERDQGGSSSFHKSDITIEEQIRMESQSDQIAPSQDALGSNGSVPASVAHAEASLARSADLPREATTLTRAEVSFEGVATTFNVVNPTDVIQSFHVAGGFYELSQLLGHRNLIPHGCTVVDCGANVGNHTLFYARHTVAGRVYPLEANPLTCEILRKNIGANTGGRAKIDAAHLGIAVGAERGRVRIEMDVPNNLGATRFRSGGDVECLPLDEMQFEGRVAFIKIDV